MAKEPFLGVVQFPHFNPEQKVKRDGWTRWNVGEHRRKFMHVSGRSIGADGSELVGDHVFWGEWEGPSRSVHTWGKQGELPRNTVIPMYLGRPEKVAGLQNTDPYVFGDCFKYTLCKQRKKNGDVMLLASLAPGSMILFGSNLGGRFVLDTVFITKEEPIRHSCHTWQEACSELSPTYKAMTLEPMYFDQGSAHGEDYSLYSARMRSGGILEVFSFVPCMFVNGEPARFARPSISIPGVVSKNLTTSFNATQMNIDDIKHCWNLVVKQVFDQGLRLGLNFDEPVLSPSADTIWSGPRE